MTDYTKILALSYFKQYRQSYVLSDLMKILGIDAVRLDKLITKLMEEDLLIFDEYLLRITEKGLCLIISKNMQGYNELDNEYLNPKIKPDKAWSLDKPYVPKKFMTKI